MDVVLWILQILLALAFAASGVSKMVVAKERVRERMPYVDDFTQGQLRLVGLVEFLGALGLVLPWATGIAPILTPLAAVGLAATMVVAAGVHVRRKENFAVNLVLLAVAVVIAIGRF
ncbi:DoxX family protein [Nonomuraea sp. NPDC050547]|uniref:DoxX family protein n=1 Tax=unclassified Nonomuraea TaxID=2593643 RepID=UPI00378C66F5